MSGLLRHSAEVTSDIVALECHRCRVRYSGPRLDEILAFEDLCCPDPDCGTYAMIPHRTSSISERFPAELANDFTPMPNALMDHAEELGLGPHELLVVWGLERHRRLMGQRVWPSVGKLSTLTGLSKDKVMRATRKLVKGGLVRRERSYWRNGRKGPSFYDMDPLWEDVAHLHHSAQVRDGDGETAPETASIAHGCAMDHSAKPASTTAHRCAIEVDVSLEEDPFLEADPVGMSSGELMQGDQASHGDVEDKEARFKAWKERNPDKFGLRALRAFEAEEASNLEAVV